MENMEKKIYVPPCGADEVDSLKKGVEYFLEGEDFPAELSATKKGFPAVWVGGGALSNTARARAVLDKEGRLKPALRVRTKGVLAAETDQAIVGLSEGDLIIEVSYWNKEDHPRISAWVVEEVTLGFPRCVFLRQLINEEEEAHWGLLPKEVTEGLLRYHNREPEGYFCAPPVKKGGDGNE